MKYMSKVGGSWKCSVCDYESKLKARTFEHVEARHVKSQGYNCSICQKFCSTYNALKLHKSRYHRQLVWQASYLHSLLTFNWVIFCDFQRKRLCQECLSLTVNGLVRFVATLLFWSIMFWSMLKPSTWQRVDIIVEYARNFALP